MNIKAPFLIKGSGVFVKIGNWSMSYHCPNCGNQIDQNILVQTIGQCLCDRCGEIVYLTKFPETSQYEEISEFEQRKKVLEALERIRKCVDHLLKHMPSHFKKDDLRNHIEYEESEYEKYCDLLTGGKAEIDRLKVVEQQESAFISSAELCLESYEMAKTPRWENRIRFLKQMTRPAQYDSLEKQEKWLVKTLTEHYEDMGLSWKRAKEFLHWARKDLNQ